MARGSGAHQRYTEGQEGHPVLKYREPVGAGGIRAPRGRSGECPCASTGIEGWRKDAAFKP